MDYFFIIRPLNCAITFISVLCGSWIGREIFIDKQILLAGVTGFLVCALGNVVNDVMDIEIDRINNPTRPLASGKARKDIAIIMSLLLAGISLSIATFLGLKPLLIVVVAIILLLCYALYLKKTPVANLIVAIVAGLSFIFGGIFTSNVYSLIPAIFAILIHTPREIVKDIIDMEGDQKYGVLSLPIILGVDKAVTLSIITLLVFIFLSPVPYFIGLLNIRYLLIVLFGAIPLTIITIIKVRDYKLTSNLLKVIMLVGLGGFILG